MRRGILMTPGTRIRKLRVQNDLGQKALADELGYKTYTTISKWESDKSLPPGRELKKIALFFGVSVDYILGLDRLIKKNEIRPLSDALGLTFYNSVDEALLAGHDVNSNQQIIEVPELSLKENKEHYFILEVKTDSINQVIPPSSNIIVLDFSVAKDTSLNTGDIIIVDVRDKYRILSLRKTDLMIYLEPLSFIEGFETITLTIDEFNDLHLIGKVVSSYQVFD